jgi:ATP-dependent DNA ligase
MNFVEILKQCETANGAGTKNIIKEALAKLDGPSRALMTYAQDAFRVYGVRKFDQPTKFADFDSDSNIPVVIAMLDDLDAKRFTGDAARALVTATLSLFTQETASYLERILDKDLRGGFSVETYNKIWKDEPVRTFSVMLADKCEDTEDFEKYVTFPCQADFKYDGERTIAVVTADSIVYYSRSGKIAEHVNGLFDEDLRILHNTMCKTDFILDGERCSDLGFTDTVNAKKAGNDQAKANLRFRAFFLMPLTDWMNQKTDITMRQNRESLEHLLAVTGVKKIILSEGREVKDYQDMVGYCNDAIDLPENASRKIEGLILKNWDSVYSWDRSFAWTKVKRFFDVDARIIAFYPGRKKTRLENTVGGCNCVGFLESGERVEFNVGSGFSDAQRADMKANPQKWLDATHVIKYQEVSRSKSKTVASLRFCTYEHARDDKTVEV